MYKNYVRMFFISLLLLSQCAYSQVDHYENALQAYNTQDFNTAYIHIKNALKQKPSNLSAKLLLAKVLIKKDQYLLAEQKLKDTLTQGTDINLIITPLGKSLLLQSKFDQALALFINKKLSTQGELSLALIKAEAYQGLDETEKAQNTYHNILIKYPNNLDANLGLVSLSLKCNNIEQVPALLKKIALLDSNNSKLFIYEGILARKNGDINKALQFFQKSNELKPNNIITYRGLANTYIDLQQFEKANLFIDKILAISPKDPQAQLMKTRTLNAFNENDIVSEVLEALTNQLSSIDKVYLHSQSQLLLIDSVTRYRQKKWYQAKLKFKIYLDKNQDDISATILLANIYIKLEQAEKALDLLEAKESRLMKNKDIALVLADLYIQFNKEFKAEYLLKKLRELYKNDPKVLILSAKIMSKLGQLNEAIVMLETSSFPNDSNYNQTLALLYFQSEQFNKSLDKVLLIKNLAPEQVDYQLLHAQVLIKLKLYKQAQQIIENLYRQYPKNKEVLSNYASLQVSLGNNPLAKKILLYLVNNEPNDGVIWLKLADIEYDLGNTENAIKIMEGQTKNNNVKNQALLKLAKLYFQQQEFEKSLVVTNTLLYDNKLNTDATKLKFKMYLEQSQDDISATILLANIYIKLEQAEKALDLLEAKESRLMKNKDIALVLVGLYIQFNKEFKAEYLLKELHDLYKDDAKVLILSAKIMSERGQLNKAIVMLESSDFPNDSNYNHALALLYFQSEQFNKSLDKVLLIKNLAPKQVDYQLLHARVLIELQLDKQAQQIIENLYRQYPTNKEVLSHYASLQASLSNNTLAKQILLDLVNNEPNDSVSWLKLADIEYDLGNTENAIKIMEVQTKNNNVKTQALLKLATLYFQQQQFEKSLVVTNSLLYDSWLNTDAIELKFKNLITLNRIKEAKYQTNILKGLWTDNALDLFKLSQLQEQVQNYEEAESNLAHAYLLAPNDLPIYIASIKLKMRLKKLSDASGLLSSANKKGFANNITIIILSGDLAQAKNKKNEAFNYYQQALKQDDSNIIALIKLTETSTTPKLSWRFRQYLSKLVKQYPERIFQRTTLADYLMINNQYIQAKYQYQQLLTRNIPSDKRGIALNNLALISIEEKDYDSAVEFSTQAVTILGSVAAIVDTKGWALTLSDVPKQGLTYLRQAYTMSSNSPDIQYHIAYTLVKLNRVSEARTLLTQIIIKPNNFPEHKMAKSLLAELQ